MAPRTGTSLKRAIALLVALSGDEQPVSGELGVTRLAEIIGEDKSQVSRSLRTLADEGFVDRDPDTLAYRLGWRLYCLAARAGDRRLLELAGPVLRRLVGQLGERSHLSVLDGTQVLTVLTESPPHAVQTAGWVGRPVPAHCTSAGRALLLDHDEASLSVLLADAGFERLGPRAPRDVRELYGRIVVARELGYAIVDEEFEPALVAAAAPVRDFRGRIVCALNVSGPKFRLGDGLADAGRILRTAAEEFSRDLGWDGKPHITESEAS
ncbi:MAG: IclR family transcriptional regulator [Actinobacteria bacterium]|nr:IclR family transcriptional regulator [Actinomycetota bacterium]